MNCATHAEKSYPKCVASALIRFVSLFFRAMGWRACRFYPSCSAYAQQSIEQKSFFRAAGLIVKRVLKCHPFSAGGYDPVPLNLKRES